MFPIRIGTPAAVAGTALALFPCVGCARVAGIDEYEVGADAADATWGCMEHPARIPSGPLQVTIHARTFPGRPIAKAGVKVCRNVNLRCDQPLTRPDLVTNESGDVVVELPGAFSGYVSVIPDQQVANPEERYVPGYYYFNFSHDSERNVDISVPLPTAGERKLLVEALGLVLHDDRGIILLQALTCEFAPAAGIAFELDKYDEWTSPWFERTGGPKSNLKVTSASGYGGFINVISEFVTVRAYTPETHREIDRADLFVQPDAVTYSRLFPHGTQSLQ